MSTGLPVMPTLFDRAVELIEAEADRAIIHSRQVVAGSVGYENTVPMNSVSSVASANRGKSVEPS